MSARLARAHSERARAGVEVRVLLPGLGGASAEERELEAMRRGCATVCRLRRVGLRDLGWVDNRAHRKILVAVVLAVEQPASLPTTAPCWCGPTSRRPIGDGGFLISALGTWIAAPFGRGPRTRKGGVRCD